MNHDDDDLRDEDLDHDQDDDADGDDDGSDLDTEGEDDGEDDGSEHDPDADEEGEDDDGEEEADGEDDGSDPDADDDDEDDELDADDPDLKDIANEDDDGQQAIPRARFNEVNKKLKEAEAENARLRGEKPEVTAPPEPPAFDLAGKIKQRNELLLEGDVEAASAIDLEIEEHRQQKATQAARTEMETDREQRRVAKVVDQVLKDYPQLNMGNKAKFSQEKFDAVMGLRDRYILQGGMKMQVALRKAADVVFDRGPGKPDGDKGKGGKEPQVPAKKLSLQEKADRAKRTPGRLRGEGHRTSDSLDYAGIDPAELSDAQLDELERKDPKTFHRIMGNIID